MGSNKKSHGNDDEAQLHFFFFPFMAQGHLRPAMDMARLFASQGQRCTVVTTAGLARTLSESLRDDEAKIEFLTVAIPGLPEGTASIHDFKSKEDKDRFITATRQLAPQLSHLLELHSPDCLVADMFFPWTTSLAAEHGVPRLVFHGSSCFAVSASLSVFLHSPHDKVSSGSEPFSIPNMPEEIKFTRDMMQDFIKHERDTGLGRLYRELKKVELVSHGVVFNSFRELEPGFKELYTGVLGVPRAWHIGPLLMWRGGERSVADEHGCLAWLEARQPGSVVYLCFGSIASFGDDQLKEIAAGLEASGKEFLWVVPKEKAAENWLPEGFEERTAGKGMVVRGWAPQELILRHAAVGAFVTHCGWNSTLEAVCAGVPMVTWPKSAEQFYNEKLVSRVLGIGIEVGVGTWSRASGDFVARDRVESVVRGVMEGHEADEMRRKAKSLAEMARLAVGEGGSSRLDLDALFRHLRSLRLRTSDS